MSTILGHKTNKTHQHNDPRIRNHKDIESTTNSFIWNGSRQVNGWKLNVKDWTGDWKPEGITWGDQNATDWHLGKEGKKLGMTE